MNAAVTQLDLGPSGAAKRRVKINYSCNWRRHLGASDLRSTRRLAIRLTDAVCAIGLLFAISGRKTGALRMERRSRGTSSPSAAKGR